MRYLLDTHAFLWAASERAKLGEQALAVIENDDNELLLSVASVWEIAIKVNTNKLSLPQPLPEFLATQLQRLDTVLMAIELRHIEPVATMPLHHRDPFDRLLFAQSLTENIPLVSVDAVADAYGVTRLW